MDPEGSEALEREFDMLMDHSGVVVPSDRKAGALAGHVELRKLVTVLRGPRSAEAEPAAVFRLASHARRD